MSLKNLNVATKIPKDLKKKLKIKKINQIYEKFEKSLNISENFVVAVSGGPDSLALAFLAKIYSIRRGLISKFLIIDHKLRPESTKEAKTVRSLLKRYSIKSKILSWNGKKPQNNIQAKAREKRYELLFNESDKYKISNILIGHHQDDLIENFFIRMLRGSGLKGLISLDKKNKFGNKNLFRPLIGHTKDELIFIAKKVFNFYIRDPSNQDGKYQRIVIRKLITELQKSGLDKNKFNNTLKNLRYSDKVINFYVNNNLKKNSFLSRESNRLILKKEYFEQPYEVIFRSLSESLKLIGKKANPVRGKKLDNTISNIKNGKFSKQTIGNCIIEKVSQTIIITKEH